MLPVQLLEVFGAWNMQVHGTGRGYDRHLLGAVLVSTEPKITLTIWRGSTLTGLVEKRREVQSKRTKGMDGMPP